jgi:hypothetical protein
MPDANCKTAGRQAATSSAKANKRDGLLESV